MTTQHTNNITADKIISWNIQGINTSRQDLAILIKEEEPAIICLQETMCKTEEQSKISGYNTIHKKRNYGTRAAGGVIVGINKNLHFQQIDITTSDDIEAIAIQVKSPININIINTYIPPDKKIEKAHIQDLLVQVPEPYILMGDFNAHNQIWGSDKTSQRGKIIEEIMEENNLTIINDEEITYISNSSGCKSILDLVLCSQNLTGDLMINVKEDNHGSDHFPVITSININQFQEPAKVSRWIMEEANWETYQNTINFDETDDPQEQIREITNKIIKAAESSIPKTKNTKNNNNRKKVPWWNEEVAKAIKMRRKALRALKKAKNDEFGSSLRMDFQNKKNEARKIMGEAQQKSWKKFVESFNVNTSIKDMWSNYRKIQGKSNNSHIKQIKYEGDIKKQNTEIANALANTFEKISSDRNYSIPFQNYKKTKETKPINIPHDDSAYNQNYSIVELEDALESTKGSSPGPDEIHYDMIKYLPQDCKQLLLKAYNKLWNLSEYPELWREATVVPIYKGKGDQNNACNYRPIYLNSCLGKIFERMVNNRLIHILENRNLLYQHQYAFRKGKSTTNYMAQLENHVRCGMSKKLCTQAVFLDIKKAYDTTWRNLVLDKLIKWKIGGKMTKYIQEILRKKTFRVRANGEKSETKTMETGLCQGSVLSVTLFLIAINTIVEAMDDSVQTLIYADDVTIVATGANSRETAKIIQKALQKIEKWEQETGFQISAEKSASIIFKSPRTKKTDTNHKIKLNNQEIPQVKHHKCLGVILDQTLSYNKHIETTVAACKQRLNYLKCVANQVWGGDRATLLKIFQATVMEKILYAAPLLSAASEKHIEKLQKVQNIGMRIISGAFHTSPIQSMLAELGLINIKKMLNQRTVIFHKKTENPNENNMESEHSPESTETDSSGELWNEQQAQKPNTIKHRVENIMEKLKLQLPLSTIFQTPKCPPWEKKKIRSDNTLINKNKQGVTNEELLATFYERKNKKYKFSDIIYTDGSKMNNRTGYSVCHNQSVIKKRMNGACSIFHAEYLAVITALTIIKNQNSIKEYVICSDSLSVILNIQKNRINNKLKDKVQLLNKEIEAKGSSVIFMWIPSHIGIPGNEKADREAKNALQLNISEPELLFEEIKKIVKNAIWNQAQNEWHNTTNNKLREIKNTIKPYSKIIYQNRKNEVTLTRLRIGHTKLTHKYLLEKEEAPKCPRCYQPVTIKHIIADCIGYEPERKKNNIPPNVREALADDDEAAKNILQFFNEANLSTLI